MEPIPRSRALGWPVIISPGPTRLRAHNDKGRVSGMARHFAERLTAHFGPITAAGLSCAVMTALSAVASAQAPAPQAQAQAPRPAAQPAKAPAAGGGDAALKQRVEQLEEQLVDMQVVIGTLESLARSGGGAPVATPRAGMSPADAARIDAMETQLRALSSQVDQLSAGGGARPQPRSDAGGLPPVGAPSQAAVAPGAGAPVAPAGPPAQPFGPKTVTSDQLDPIGGLIESTAPPASGTLQTDAFAPMVSEPAAPATPALGSKQLYETAYGHLLRQDYGAAQTGFTEFLKQYPRDTLAPDALYWLGETHFVQQNFNDAAEAFDLVTSSFASSSKAPDAQIRRATALAQAGKKDQACAAFRQFSNRFPNARPAIKTKADAERQRAGCV